MTDCERVLGLTAAGWTAVQGIAAALGVIGLGAYVELTRRIMKASEEARRGEFEPFLVAEHKKTDKNAATILLHNLGRGAAIGIEHWVVRGANLAFVIPAKRPMDQQQEGGFTPDLGDLMPTFTVGPEKPVVLRDYSDELHVFQTSDVLGGRHQLQIMYKLNNNGILIWTVLRVTPNGKLAK